MASREAIHSYFVLLDIQELSLEPKMNCKCNLLDEMAMRIGGLKSDCDDSQQMPHSLFASLPYFTLIGY